MTPLSPALTKPSSNLASSVARGNERRACTAPMCGPRIAKSPAILQRKLPHLYGRCLEAGGQRGSGQPGGRHSAGLDSKLKFLFSKYYTLGRRCRQCRKSLLDCLARSSPSFRRKTSLSMSRDWSRSRPRQRSVRANGRNWGENNLELPATGRTGCDGSAGEEGVGAETVPESTSLTSHCGRNAIYIMSESNLRKLT